MFSSNRIFGFIACVAISGLMVGCSSSGSSSSDAAVDASSISNVSGTLNSLESLLFDDAESSSSRLNSRAQGQGPQAGDFSHLGCQYKQNRDRMFARFHEFRKPLCYIASVEEQTDFVIGDNAYTIYQIQDPGAHESEEVAAEEADEDFRLRVGIFDQTDSDRRCMRFQICRNGSQEESMEVCETGDNAISAAIQHIFNDDEFSGSGSIAITASGDGERLTDLTMRSKFSDNFGGGDGTLTASRTTRRNSFSGYFSGEFEGFTHSDAQSVIVQDGVGSGRLEGSAQFPPHYIPDEDKYYCPPSSNNYDDPWEEVSSDTTNCPAETFTVSESFEFTNGGTSGPSCQVIANSDSPVFDEVSDLTLPTSAEDPDSFAVEWDCSGELDGTVDFASVDVSACEALEDHRDENGEDNCFQEAHDPEGGDEPQP